MRKQMNLLPFCFIFKLVTYNMKWSGKDMNVLFVFY